MTPREIMYAVLPALDRKDREMANQFTIAAIGFNDPKKAIEAAEDLT